MKNKSMIKVVDRFNHPVKPEDIVVSQDNPGMLAVILGIDNNQVILKNLLLKRIDRLERQIFTASNWVLIPSA